MSRPGDWNCRSCQHLNFQRRDSCQRCGDSKFASVDFGGSFGGGGGGGVGWLGAGSSSSGFSSSDVRPGDWYCTVGNCGAHNFASRSSCFKCGAYKDIDSGGINGGFDDNNPARSRGGGNYRSGWKSGDWICTRWGCNEHNFASRMECFKCNAPRDFSGSRTSY